MKSTDKMNLYRAMRKNPVLRSRLAHNRVVEAMRLVSDSLRISCCQDPVLILTLPKTGGTTVHHSMSRQRLAMHLHELDSDAIDKQVQVFRERRGYCPHYLLQGRLVRSKIDRNPGKKWKIVTVLRDPIARFISLFFQTGREFHGAFLRADGTYSVDEVVKFLNDSIGAMAERRVSREAEWFNRNIRDVFELDVLRQPFDPNTGYSIQKNEKAQLLVLKTEGLDQAYEKGVSEFLGPGDWKLQKFNVGSDKDYAEVYRRCLGNICVRREILEQIYADDFVANFYTATEIDRFVSRWSDSGSSGTRRDHRTS